MLLKTIISILAFLFFYIFIRPMLLDEIGSTNRIYQSILLGVSVLFIAGMYHIYKEYNLKIMTDDTGLTLIKDKMKTKYMWDEISEFGKIHTGYGLGSGFQYFLRTFGEDKKRIMLSINGLDQLDNLIETIYENAKDASFMIINNVTEVPFAKEWKIDRIKRDA